MFDIQTYKKRSLLTQKIRDFFAKNGFLEVETPIMTTMPGMEPHLNPFETKLTLPSIMTIQKSVAKPNRPQSIPLYLNTSPELQMKKLLGAGFGNIFNITKVFRNGEIGGPLHNPEFTMIEWYRTNAAYTDLMKDCENLILSLVGKIPKNLLTYQSQTINLTPPWPRLSTNQLFQKYCKIDLNKNRTFKKFKKIALTRNFDTKNCKDWDDIFFKIFLNHIEPNLPKNKPIFIYDYPSTQAALARKKKSNPFFAERFELYIAGIELANAFSELINPNEQRKRLKEEQLLRKKLNKTVFDIDEEFLSGLGSIKKPCAGIAMGMDRLFMLLTNKKNIEEVLLFPLNKMLNNL
ncbi:MAG: EF-P lysine aminoacylase EpmA [Patescibacteria group bacterium]